MVLSFVPLWLLLAAALLAQRYIAFHKPVLTLGSFRNDQMMAFARCPVLQLVRIQIGKLTQGQGDLKPGEWRDFQCSDLL